MSRKLRTVLVLSAWLAVATTARASWLSWNDDAYPHGDEFATSSHWVCSSFGTDSMAYNLTSVVLATGGSSGLDSDAVLEIYTSTGEGVGQPGVLVGTLTTPAHITQPFTTFLAQGIVLGPSSTYWVVLHAKPGPSTIGWNWTHDVVGGGVGFQCTWGISDDGGATWATYQLNPQIMLVNAQPVPWTDLGLALVGSHHELVLDGHGTLETGSSGSITLNFARPFAPALMFVSTSSTPLPFKGGTLATVPVLQSLPITMDQYGWAEVPWSAWPPGLSGLSIFVQCAIQDPSAVKGVALSNALRADVP